MTAAPVVVVEAVRFAYPDGPFELAIDALAISRGERVACTGPSGSGKTTLAHLIAGILQPQSGTVRVDGTLVSSASDAERREMRLRRIGMVFQQFELIDYLGALDNILLPYHLGARLGPAAEIRTRAQLLADAMGLGGLLDRVPARLSQGERQRVAICRALVTDPVLVLADEPTGNLDSSTGERILDLLLERCDALGAALLMVTHDHSQLGRFHSHLDLTAAAAEP